MKVADLYIRVSTEEQKLTGFSQRYQEEILKSYCEINSIEVDHVIMEDYSAKTFNRPAWNKLYSIYKSRIMSVPRLLLITKWDRFSRNTGDAYQMITQLARLHIEVRAIEQPLDTLIPESKIMMAFYLALPEVENERRGLNIKQGLERGVKEGRWMGLAPVGYVNRTLENGRKCIESLEPYSTFMQVAFQELEKGIYTVAQVYRGLVEAGFNKSLNCFWKAIRNPVYCGKIRLKGGVHKGETYIKGQHTGIVSESLFLKVQEVLARKKKQKRNTRANEIFPLRGSLLCPHCGGAVTASASTSKTKRQYYYYHCKHRQHLRIRLEQVHRQFDMLLKKLVPTTYFKSIYQRVFIESVNNLLKDSWKKKEKLQKKIEGFFYREDKINSLFWSNSIDISEYQSLKKECQVQKNILEETHLKISNEIQRITISCKNGICFVSEMLQLYRSLFYNEKRELINYLFPYGIIYKDSSFALDTIAPGLRLIYGAELRSIQTTTPSSISKPFLEHHSSLHNELIHQITIDHPTITLKHAGEIVAFFKRIAEWSIRVAGY